MKNVAKIAAPTLLLGAVLMLAACGGSKDAAEEKTAPAKEASAEGDDHGAEGEAGHEEGEATVRKPAVMQKKVPRRPRSRRKKLTRVA